MALSKSFIRNAAMTPLDARLANMAQIVGNADGSPRTGVIGNAKTSIVATTATMNVTVAAAEFATSKGKADGVAIFTNDGTVNVAIGAAPASNSRIDVIWVKHFDDTTGDTAGQFLPLFGVTAGVAAAAPTKPAIPTGALELATLHIYSGTTATNGGSNTLTNTYQMTTSRGGVVPFRTVLERDAWANPTAGQLAYLADIDAVFEYVDATIGWVHLLGKPIKTALTYSTNYSAFAGMTPALVEMGGRVFLEGRVTSTSLTHTAGVFAQCATIPAPQRPAMDIAQIVNLSDATGYLRVAAATGIVTYSPIGTFTGPMQLNLFGLSWPDKRLG